MSKEVWGVREHMKCDGGDDNEGLGTSDWIMKAAGWGMGMREKEKLTRENGKEEMKGNEDGMKK